MKKIIIFVVLAAMLLGVCGCSKGNPDGDGQLGSDAGSFRVGYNKISIQPQEALGLGGYGNTSARISEGYLDELFATCIAISDKDDNTVLLVTIDSIRIGDEMTASIRQEITKVTGVPGNNVMLVATHSHSTPDIGVNASPEIVRHEQYMQTQIVAAAQAALADRSAATIFGNTVTVPGLSYVRHYELENGTFAGPNFGDFNSAPIKGHTTEADTSMQILKFAREDAQDVVLCSWRCHPTITGGMKTYDYSSDFVGPMRDYVEEKTGALVAYYQADAGNIAPDSMIEGEQPTTDFRMYGQQLGSYLIGGMNEMTELPTGAIKTKQEILAGEVDHTRDGDIAAAREVYKVWTSNYDRNAANAAAQEKGMRSVYVVTSIINRYELPATVDLELNTITIGDKIAFASFPGEMFDTNGAKVRADSGYDMTMILGYANNAVGYIPSAYGYEYTCYESDATKFVAGTGEIIQDKLLEMIHGM